MNSIETYKKHKEEKKQEKQRLKREKQIQKKIEKDQLSFSSKQSKSKKKTKSGKSIRKKLLPRKSVIKKLDRLTSWIVRLKDTDENGNVRCISCDKQLPRKEAQCCHWIERGRQRYRFDYINLASGCSSCNYYRKEYHTRRYTVKQIIKLGEEKVNEMLEQAEHDKNKTYSMPTGDLRQLLEERMEERKTLQDNKKTLL